MVLDRSLVSETADRLYRAHVGRLMSLGGSAPNYDKVGKVYERVAKRVIELGATPEAYLDSQYESVDDNQAKSLTIRTIDAAKDRCEKNWRSSRAVKTSRSTMHKEEASLHVARVWYAAKERGCSVYDVVNDREFTLPAWFRVLNSNDREVIEIYSDEAREVMTSPEFESVKEELQSVHGRLPPGV